MKNKYYIHKCEETNRIFICEVGVDNNLCEVFSRDDQETIGDNAEFICEALNKMK